MEASFQCSRVPRAQWTFIVPPKYTDMLTFKEFGSILQYISTSKDDEGRPITGHSEAYTEFYK